MAVKDFKSFRKNTRGWFLSNFYPTPVTMPDGFTYPNAEAAFQAQKCATDAAKEKYKNPALAPIDAKRMGKIEPGLPDDWDERALDVMLDVLRAKFANPELRDKLIATEDAQLVETNKWCDNKWGVCHCSKCANVPKQNLLGKLLMQVREEIK